MNYKSFGDLSRDIKKSLGVLHAGEYDLVVGIPRSGMIPAYVIGLYLNVNVTDFYSFIENRPLGAGHTRKLGRDLQSCHDAQRVLIVDDSIATGNSLSQAMEKVPSPLRERVTTLAVYSNQKKRDDVDVVLECLSVPRVFEWNIFHRNLLSEACVDIDGVLCADPTEEQNDDGENYIEFLLNAEPLFIPTYRIHSLVTSRLEKYRPYTEDWLQRHGIQYDNLIMIDLPSKEERIRQRAHAVHKMDYFKSDDSLKLFIESDIRQARRIAQGTGKPVYCVDENRMITPPFFDVVIKNPNGAVKIFKSVLERMLPDRVLRFLVKVKSHF